MKTNKKKIILGIIGGFFLIGIIYILVLLKEINPENSNVFPPCITYKLTGIKCAGCGITRAMHQILNLNFKSAFMYNPLIFIYFAFLVYVVIKYLLYKIFKNNKLKITKKEKNNILYMLLAITIIFIIARNIFGI